MRKHLAKLLLLGMLLTLFVVPVAAQDEPANIIIDSTFGEGPTTFNTVTCSDADCIQIVSFMYPTLIGVNPETGIIEPGIVGIIQGGVVDSWTVSNDGLVYTFTLSDKFFWSDGEPVTAYDYQFWWDAVVSEQVENPYVFLQDTIASVVAEDERTLVITYSSNTCEALNDAGIYPIPSHLYQAGDFAPLKDQTYTDPATTLTIGPFQLASYSVSEQTSLVPVEGDGYPNQFGSVIADGYIYRVVGDQTVMIEQFLAGQTDVINFIPPNRRSDVRAAADRGEVTLYTFSPGNAYDYLAFNLADPANPQPALDDDGNLIEQDPNPFFADVRVRQALSMAVDVDAIIQGAVFGEGTRMQSPYSKGSWPYNPDVPFYDYDPEAALALLADAGWVDDDNDPATPLVAQGALNAPDGTPFEFTLLTNEGNTRREAIGTIVQDQLAQIGVKVHFQTVAFEVLLDTMDNQEFDAFILGWQESYPYRADQAQLWSPTSDVIGGDNFTSYNNPELMELFDQARTVPGCNLEERARIYGQIQEILHRDAPYLFLYSIDGMYAYRSDWQGLDPYPANLYWNISQWTRMP